MPFVKLDTGILNSTLWVERDQRHVFITALLMAVPHEVQEPTPQLAAFAGGIKETGFVVPPGWYGFIQAAGPGIVRMAMVETEAGMQALRDLGEPDPESRSGNFGGRRLVRVDGGYIVLNFMRYRDKDMTAADRSARYRQRQKESAVTRDSDNVTRDTSCGVTKAEAEAEAEQEKRKASATPPPRPLRVAPAPLPAFDGENGEGLNAKAVVPLASNWELPEQWGFDAVALGWKPAEVLHEGEKFRQFWTSGKGAGKRRSLKGWRQSWSTWLGKAAEYRK